MFATKMKENATRIMAPGYGPKNSATATEKNFRALISMFFCHELGGHCLLEELSAPGGRLSCLNEKKTPHLALQQLRLETVAGLLYRREMSSHSFKGEWLGRQVVCAA